MSTAVGEERGSRSRAGETVDALGADSRRCKWAAEADSSHPAAGIAAAVVRHSRRRCRLGIQTFLGDGEEAKTDSKRSLDEAFLLGRLGKAAQASAPLGAKLAGGWSREFG